MIIGQQQEFRLEVIGNNGALVDADVLPVVTILIDGVETPSITVVVASVSTGVYSYIFTLPNTVTAGAAIAAKRVVLVDGVQVAEGTNESLGFAEDDVTAAMDGALVSSGHVPSVVFAGGGSGGGGSSETPASIKSKYESNANTNAFTDAEQTKLAGLSDDALVAGDNVSELTNDAAFITAGQAPIQTVNGQAGTVVLGAGDVGLGAVDNTADVDKPISTAAQTALDGKADLAGGFVPSSQIPAIAITEFLGTVGTDAAMLALVGQQGDWCLRSDKSVGYVITGSDPSQLSNWKAVTIPGSAVTAVNSQIGDVVLGKADVGLGNVDNTSDADKPISTAAQSVLDAKADLVGGLITTSQIPAIAITEFLGSVANDAAMLALVGQQGDWCLRSDLAVGYVIIGNDPSQLSNWEAVTVPGSAVTSINGQVGTVVLGASDVGAATAAQGATADSALQSSDIGATVQAFNANTVIDATYVATDENFSTAEKLKLSNIETGATADQTGAEIKTAYEDEANTNVFTDAEKAKLASVDAAHYLAPVQSLADLSAIPAASITDKARVFVENELSDYFYNLTATSGDVAPDDQTGGTGFWVKVIMDGETAASIKTKYESNPDTNGFTDAEKTKLAGVEAGADVTDAANVQAAGALMDSELTNEGAVKSIDQGLASTDEPDFEGINLMAPVGDPTADVAATIGADRTDDGDSYLDLVSDDTNSPYSFRLIREAGENGEVELIQKGTGDFKVNLGSTDIFSLSTTAATFSVPLFDVIGEGSTTGSSDPIIRVRSTGTGSSDDAVMQLRVGGSTARSLLYFGDTDDLDAGRIYYEHTTDSFKFSVNGGTEVMELSSTEATFSVVTRYTPMAEPTGQAGDIYFDSTSNKHRGHNGTQWNDLY